jgi:hypothetical protein
MAQLRLGEWLVRLRRGSLGVLGLGSWGRVGVLWVGLSGAREGQSAVAVELEEVVDGALEAPLGAGGVLAA